MAREKSRVAEVLENIRLFHPVLIVCGLDRSTPPGDAAGEKPERFYDSAVRLVEPSRASKVSVAACIFSAGQKIKDFKTLTIDATYFVAFKCDEELAEGDKKRLLEQLARSSAWQLFRDLFIHMGSQTGEELPLLPNSPKLRWLKPQEEAEAQSA
jgi:hypothetical protein